MIISTRNAKIKWVRGLQGASKARREAGVLVVEGVRLVEEAHQAGWAVELVLHSPELNRRGQELVEAFQAQGAMVEAVDERVLRAASDTQTPQGILAVIKVQSLPRPANLDPALVIDGVRDPGNLGTMLRTAAAAGVRMVYLTPGGVDPYSPKVVRAGMGAHFRLPLEEAPWDTIRAELQAAGLRLYLAAAGEGQVYSQVDLRRPLALIIGGEAEGAGSQARTTAAPIHIPMPGGMESLNAAIAAGVLLFEINRQRKDL